MDFTNPDGTTDHRYVLLGVGQDQIENPAGLSWQECFRFLYDHYEKGVTYVGFFLGYDFTQILKGLPESRARMLFTSEGQKKRTHRIPGKQPHPVECNGWQFDMLASKRLRIRPKLCTCENATCGCIHAPWLYLCDSGGYFQTSLLTVINPKTWQTPVVTDEEYRTIKEGKERRSSARLDDDMRRYNRLENEIFARVMTSVDQGLHDIGIHLPPSRWFGPGQAAQEWLTNEGVPKRTDIEAVVPPWFLEAARMSYFGGWFEIMMHGIIPGEAHEYDINSAYPSIIAKLPCLLHGRYDRGDGLPPENPGALCLVYASVVAPGMPQPTTRNRYHVGTMLHRDHSGGILRPLATEGWFWLHELQAAQRAGLIQRLNNRGKYQRIHRWVSYTPCDCLPPMRRVAYLYAKRLAVGKTSPLGKAAKLTYNSAYGKFAQSVGSPKYANPVYASLITAGTRTQILDAIATHPYGASHVGMVATDALYFITPHSGLSISESLGEWDYKKRSNLTLFKPGVYWDDEARRQIATGESPHFKARGIRAADFASAIARIDEEFRAWGDSPPDVANIFGPLSTFPAVQFTSSFSLTSCLQAIRRNDWSQAGRVEYGKTFTQDCNPYEKRNAVYSDRIDDGRRIYRSSPHSGMALSENGWEFIPSTPYAKRFGLNDPFSDESREEHGITPEGNIRDIVSWVLAGKA